MVTPDNNLSDEDVPFAKDLMMDLFQRVYMMYALQYNIILQQNMSFPISVAFLV